MSGSEPRGFLQSCLLLLLFERPDHGYELAERLKPLGITDSDPGSVYRSLRSLEKSGAVESVWTAGVGPARRTYEVTPQGCAALQGWARELAEVRGSLDTYLNRYDEVSRARPDGQPEPEQLQR